MIDPEKGANGGQEPVQSGVQLPEQPMKRRIFDWVEHVKGDYTKKPDLREFTHLRLFHGCRPLDVRTYYEKGIVVMPLTEFARQLREIFSDFPPEALEHAIAQVKRSDDAWRVDAALDLRYLIEHASQYIVQGSETLSAFAANLPIVDGEDPRERLRNVGVPTAFVIEVPLDEVDLEAFEELDEKLSILALKGTDEACDGGDMVDFTVSFSKGVPHEWLIRHETIHKATDPSDRSRIYRYSD
jgi:hypothetical protein